MDIAFAMATAKRGLFGELIAFCSDTAIGTNSWREDCAPGGAKPASVQEVLNTHRLTTHAYDAQPFLPSDECRVNGLEGRHFRTLELFEEVGREPCVIAEALDAE
jgi:hypothetical protein